MRYAVIQNVTERTGPSITTFGGKIISSGSIVEIADIVEKQNETWGRIANRERAYVAINIGDTEYMSPLQSLPDANVMEKLITWAKIQGFKP